MQPVDVRTLRPLERLVYWMTERERVRERKARALPKPWTLDPILQSYRFTNVRRMDDKVSVWLLGHWYAPYLDHPLMLPAVALARFINRIPTLAHVGFPIEWDAAAIMERLRTYRDSDTVFSAAYMVRGNDGVDKIESVVRYNVSPLVDDPPPLDAGSMRHTWIPLCRRYGFGSFMAGQVVADLRWAVPGKWEDAAYWAPMGPGSRRGMNRLHGRPPDAKLTQVRFLDELNALIDTCRPLLPLRIVDRLEAMDWQNCLCEFDKYERVLWGQGRPKQLYPGTA